MLSSPNAVSLLGCRVVLQVCNSLLGDRKYQRPSRGVWDAPLYPGTKIAEHVVATQAEKFPPDGEGLTLGGPLATFGGDPGKAD
jgi:hypothetical protein